MTSLADRLTNSIKPTAESDSNWVRFVKDHRTQLLASTEPISIAAGTMFYNRFRAESLFSVLGIPEELIWLTMWLNDIKNKSDILNIEELQVPNIVMFNRLYKQYQANKAS